MSELTPPSQCSGTVARELEGFRAFLQERDRRHAEQVVAQDKAVAASFAAQEKAVAAAFAAQEKAIAAAFAAQERLTAAAFASSEKAVEKAETAQRTYNEIHNDLQRQMSVQAKELIHQTVFDREISRIAERLEDVKLDIQKLREGASSISGRDRGIGLSWSVVLAVAGLATAVGALLGKALFGG